MKKQSRPVVGVLVGSLGLWLVCAVWVVPAIIESAYRGELVIPQPHDYRAGDASCRRLSPGLVQSGCQIDDRRFAERSWILARWTRDQPPGSRLLDSDHI